MARAGERAAVWDRPQLRALCPGGGVPSDAPHPQLSPQGSRFDWSGVPVRLSVPGAHNCLNAAGALTACALAGAEPAAAAAAAAADAAPGSTIAWLPGFAEARRFLERSLRDGDLCLVMGAGDVDSLGRSLVA